MQHIGCITTFHGELTKSHDAVVSILFFFPAAKLHYKALNRHSIFSLYKFIMQQLLQLNSLQVCDCKWEVAISVIRKDAPAKHPLHYNIARTISTLPRDVSLLGYTVYVLC